MGQVCLEGNGPGLSEDGTFLVLGGCTVFSFLAKEPQMQPDYEDLIHEAQWLHIKSQD